MGKLDGFLGYVPGYFREDAEEEFPWASTGSGIWYSLLVVESGGIERYGFTSAKSSKVSLCLALNEIKGKKSKALLLGVWTGQYRTDLFVLDIQKAIKKLNSL